MLNIDDYCKSLGNNTNFVSMDSFDEKLSIIKETLGVPRHNMLIGEVYQNLAAIYSEFQDLELADLLDFLEIERSYGRIYQKR